MSMPFRATSNDRGRTRGEAAVRGRTKSKGRGRDESEQSSSKDQLIANLLQQIAELNETIKTLMSEVSALKGGGAQAKEKDVDDRCFTFPTQSFH